MDDIINPDKKGLTKLNDCDLLIGSAYIVVGEKKIKQSSLTRDKQPLESDNHYLNYLVYQNKFMSIMNNKKRTNIKVRAFLGLRDYALRLIYNTDRFTKCEGLKEIFVEASDGRALRVYEINFTIKATTY